MQEGSRHILLSCPCCPSEWWVKTAPASQFHFCAATAQPKAPEADGQPGTPAVEPREKTVADVLAAPLDQEVSRDEQRLMTGIMRRLSHAHQSSVGLPLQTGGWPVHVSFTPAASSTEPEGGVSDRTRRRRQDSLQRIEKLMCGSDEAVQHQRAFHLARSTQAEREEPLFQAKVHHYVSPAESLSMAVNLRLTNDQLRKIRLWTKRWNVYLAGERHFNALPFHSQDERIKLLCSIAVEQVVDHPSLSDKAQNIKRKYTTLPPVRVWKVPSPIQQLEGVHRCRHCRAW